MSYWTRFLAPPPLPFSTFPFDSLPFTPFHSLNHNAMNPLSKVLDDALRRLDGGVGLEARAVMLWPEIVGPQIARATEATGARGGTLLITVRSEAWSSELSFLKADLLRRYRKRLGE